ncbi:hypothetical protein H6G76_23215 [Nostoc sp. FACHB-152]|uniref:hypothetical protein n=1 Tax=unclassified Nostoc TaxID=2593658 RepID=UPI0016869D58|nr:MULTISPECIES: hypothetical protein [unclassified Nostoc]MBD2450018.1 hypothetical protein [Nostoc sp. FACHB-152]MBD2470138.1 hypothetical protein [Nostoc sp. FACHB-145]
MGRWTPLILMGGGLAILLGTLLGINFPMGQQQTASNNTPGGKTSRVLPANINVNSTAPSSRSASEDRASTTQENNTTPEARGGRSVRQENLSPAERNTSERRTSVAQNTTPSESFSTPDNTDTTTREVQSTESQSSDTSVNDNESAREPIRALW